MTFDEVWDFVKKHTTYGYIVTTGQWRPKQIQIEKITARVWQWRGDKVLSNWR